ncbi:MAG: recombinase family protein [Candidatus Acidiferrales bacterium]
MRVAIYARVSSERQEKEHTIGSQLEALRNYAAQNGMEIVEEFTDEGYSGTRLDRPALDRMRDLAERRGFEVLLTYCTDRLARKFVLQALILEEMERFGVKTIFLEGGAADDPLSKLMHQITGAVAEFERTKIVERNRRGKLYRARCGEVVTWRAPFGYVRIPRRDGVAPHVEIDENKAVVVRRIFNLYAKQGWTVRQIAKQLTLQETPAPGGGREWNFYTVDRILHNEAYVGTLYYNRHNCAVIEGTHGHKRPSCQRILRPKEEWIPISIAPIIDLETFHQAGNRVKDNQRFSPRNLQEDAYLLRRLVRCGHCGLSCRVSSNTANPNCSHYYVCPGTKKHFLIEKRCSQRCIGADALDELVWEEVSTRLQDPDLVLEAYRECRIHRRNGEEAGLSEQGQKLATQIKLANTEMTRLLDAYQAGTIELPELQKRRRLVDAKLDTLHREKELLEKMAREQKQEGDIRRDLEEFRALVSDRAQHSSFEDKQKLMRMVLDKVVVKDWRVDVHYNIPLYRPAASREEKVSTNFDLCNARHESPEGDLPKLGYSLYREAGLCTALSCRMAGENHRSRRAPPGGVLLPTTRRPAASAPTSAARAVGRGQEAQRVEIVTRDSVDRSDPGGSDHRDPPDTASLSEQATALDLQWVGD